MKPIHLLTPLLIAFPIGGGFAQPPAPGPAHVIRVTSNDSLLHLGSLDSYDVTRGGKQAAADLLQFIEREDRAAGARALQIWESIIPKENFGGEYTSLKWLVECLLAEPETREKEFLTRPEVRSFYQFLATDNFAELRIFLRHKYHLDTDPKEKSDATIQRRNRFLEDFLLFGNPRRESWEKSGKMLDALRVEPGMTIADVGSGPGYFTLKFAELVGDAGMVYAIDTNRDSIEYLDNYLKEQGIRNVRTRVPSPASAELPDGVDLIFICSVYHNLYATQSHAALTSFLDDLRRALKPGGRVVIVDNGPVESTLPYHGPYIARELIVSQLALSGFEHVETHQFIPQRYMLVFKADTKKPRGLPSSVLTRRIMPAGLTATRLEDLPPSHDVAEFVDGDPTRIRVLTAQSLVPTSGAQISFSVRGRGIATTLLKGLKNHDPAKILQARDGYDTIIPEERLGDEHTALRWFAEYALATDEGKKAMTASPLTSAYVDFFGENDFERLKIYLESKYLVGDLDADWHEFMKTHAPDDKARAEAEKIAGGKASARTGSGGASRPSEMISRQTPGLAAPAHQTRESNAGAMDPWVTMPYPMFKMKISFDTLAAWDQNIVFSNPAREHWEKTSRMLEFLDIKTGQSVADVGSGAGYYTLKFAESVGASGKVYALEMSEEQHKDLRRVAERSGFKNIETVLSKENDAMLPENCIDLAFLCSIYHATYVTSMRYVRDQFLASVRKALKPGGKLVVVDNEPIPHEFGGYYGPRIAKELVIAQLLQYGFRFSAYAQFVPQRYVLVFDPGK